VLMALFFERKGKSAAQCHSEGLKPTFHAVGGAKKPASQAACGDAAQTARFSRLQRPKK